MIISIQCVFALSVIYSNILISSTMFVQQFVDGSLTETWRMKYSIFAETFNGVILNCIDYERNNLLIQSIVSEGNRFIKIRFNTLFRNVLLKTYCGCDPCDNTLVNISIESRDKTLGINCNNGVEESMPITAHKDLINDENIDKIYARSSELATRRGSILIMIGNVGPYIGDDNKTVHPIRDQMYGCVYFFYYNDIRISFTGNNSRVRSYCSPKCKHNTCHGGLCHQESDDIITCDCSNVTLNGPFCNQTMRPYIPRGNNSYFVRNYASDTHLKISWKYLLPRHYCLVEIINKDENVMISILNNELLITSETNFNIDHGDDNFVTLNFTNGNLIIKSRGKVRKKDILLSGETRLNIGFSERNRSCEIFSGILDVHLTSSNIEPIKVLTNEKKDNDRERNKQNKSIFMIKILVIVSVMISCLMIGLVICVIYFLRTKKEIQTQIQILTANSTRSMDMCSVAFTDTGFYGKVDDNDNYDDIKETDVYATIDD